MYSVEGRVYRADGVGDDLDGEVRHGSVGDSE